MVGREICSLLSRKGHRNPYFTLLRYEARKRTGLGIFKSIEFSRQFTSRRTIIVQQAGKSCYIRSFQLGLIYGPLEVREPVPLYKRISNGQGQRYDKYESAFSPRSPFNSSSS
ncbi:hypothetical protein AVEN_158350-1 [Araneus ventricosus]|uniref:Uncharacterized protein n=1 Tax=Araneus ventricosus TaxID=182803 RepID=A0A4Y2FAR8_ARAVE|nr:hypothetical protein AVEN_158350-1 [Araneus ventricosus]